MITIATKWVYDFSEGSREMRELLGGKGSGIAEMTRVLGPELVPAGFTITTEACVAYMRDGDVPAGFGDAVDAAIARLEAQAGRRFGDPADPLLVSVRSGARDSMPGMMDTVLNLGLNDESVAGLAEATGNARFAWDSYRRLVQMFGDVVCGVPGVALRGRDRRDQGRARRPPRHRARRRRADRAHPPLPGALRLPAGPARAARARDPRRLRLLDGRPRRGVPAHQRHPRRLGHGGQRPADGLREQGERSGSGVAFSRDEVTGAPEPSGDFLIDAQGEDVVSGVRTPRDLSELADLDARRPPAAARHPAHARAPLPGHAGHRVHDRGRPPVHAADAQRQAPRAGRRPLRRRRRRAKGC